ncbi:SDR family NAD(P)-dependent oxidoreductase [Streptomyces sp. NPDC051014]|uniref:SDR family NAD(P)-dependent oxidoreductase n=1 Tax=Streptomyces sp. NPDC051014 TaxID=3155751 RepID=UPI00340C8E01
MKVAEEGAARTASPEPQVLPGRLEGRRALVAGGTQGIGRAIAEVLAASGADTALCGRTEDKAEAVASEIAERFGQTVAGFGADVTDEHQVAGLLARVTERLGPIDILIVAVGGWNHTYPVGEFPLDSWNETLTLNLTSAFLLSRGAVPGMRERGWGRVIFIGSPAGRGPGRGHNAAYGASKMGLIGLANSLVADQAPLGVTVNVVIPGSTLSERTLKVWAQQGGVEAVAKNIAVGRVGRPEEIAGVVPFLVSDLGAYTTGAVIDITGGR